MVVASCLVAMVCVVPVHANASYEIEFKAGAHGTINGESKVSYVQEAGSVFPNEPVVTPEDGYRFVGWSKELPEVGSAVEGRMTFVAKYAVVLDGVEYIVRYVDNYGLELDTPKAAVGERGESVTERARYIEGYRIDQTTQTVVLNEDHTEIVFTYVSTAAPEQVIEEIDRIVPGTGGDQGTTTPPAGDQGEPEQPGEDIEDPDTPLAGDDDTNDSEEIEDDDTALAGGSENVMLYVGGAIVLVAAVAIYFFMRNKKNVANDTNE